MAVDEQKKAWIEMDWTPELFKLGKTFSILRWKSKLGTAPTALRLTPSIPLYSIHHPDHPYTTDDGTIRKEHHSEVVTPRTARSPFQISDTGAQGAEMEACNASAGSILSFCIWILDALGIWRNMAKRCETFISRIDSRCFQSPSDWPHCLTQKVQDPGDEMNKARLRFKNR